MTLDSIRLSRPSKGVTLIELMVGLTIGLTLALAASLLYVSTQETARSTRSLGDINETGRFALDLIGRELEKAGFYPAEFETNASAAQPSEKQTGQYVNIKNAGAAGSASYDQGLFGCSGARFDPSVPGCPAAVSGESDSIVVNYFVTTEFGGGAVVGNLNDCNRRPASGDLANVSRSAASMPVLVSNRFGLVASTMTRPDGSRLAMHVLGCNGNGRTGSPAADTDATYQPLLQGVESMAFSYGVYTVGATSQSPVRFYAASDFTPTGIGVAAWQRVTSVKVCVVVRSLENARQPDKTGQVRVKPNCQGQTTGYAAGDNFLYKRFEQVFAIRNNLTGLL